MIEVAPVPASPLKEVEHVPMTKLLRKADLATLLNDQIPDSIGTKCILRAKFHLHSPANQFDTCDGKLLWFTGPPMVVAPKRKLVHSAEYLQFIKHKRERSPSSNDVDMLLVTDSSSNSPSNRTPVDGVVENHLNMWTSSLLSDAQSLLALSHNS